MGWWEEQVGWSSGPWSLEVRGDEIADIALGGRTVLRSVRFVVRDRDWETAEVVVDAVDSRASGVEVRMHTVGGLEGLVGLLTITTGSRSLRVDLDVEAQTDVLTNRAGLVVLHPAALAGSRLEVAHRHGDSEATAFPQEIAPHQPAVDISELHWHDGDVAWRLSFAGDRFEMEDQRNWTDASFKTYSRPLALPFPYTVARGERVAQTITLTHADEPTSSAGSGTRAPRSSASIDEISLLPPSVMPAFGVGASTAPDPAPAHPPTGSFVHVELDLGSSTWPAALDRAVRSGQPLDVRLVRVDIDPRQLPIAVERLRPHHVLRIGAYGDQGEDQHAAGPGIVSDLRVQLRRLEMPVPVVGGVRTHFTELNRGRGRLGADVDAIGFATTPLFHSRSTEQLVESVLMQRLVASEAVRHASGTPVHVGPVSLRPHVNAVATTPAPSSGEIDLRDGYGPALIDATDQRQFSPELGAWLIASAAALSVCGVASVSYFEEWGPRGFYDARGAEGPAVAALGAVSSLSGAPASVGRSDDGLVWVIAAHDDDIAIVSNLDRVDRVVAVNGVSDVEPLTVGAGSWAVVPVASS